MMVNGNVRVTKPQGGERWHPRRFFRFSGAVAVLLLLSLIPTLGGVAAQVPRQMEGGGSAGIAPGAQSSALAEPHVAVIGTGNAMTPATRGTLQLVVRRNDLAMSGAEPAVSGGLPVLSEAEVRPVVDALVAQDVPERVINVVVSGSYYGSAFGPGTAQLLVRLDRDGLERLEPIVAAGTEAAIAAGLIPDVVGINYETSDCDGLIREANRAAAVDAKERADRVAAAMDLRLGDVIQVIDQSAYAGGSGFGCDTGTTGAMGAGIYYPPYDPATAANVVVYRTLTVAYAIEPEAA